MAHNPNNRCISLSSPKSTLEDNYFNVSNYWGGDPRKQSEEMWNQDVEEKSIKCVIPNTVLISYC